MRFKKYVLNGFTFIDAYPEEGDNLEARRIEGEGVPIQLRTTTAWFNSEFHELHPDVTAAVCLAIFYPFIGSRVEFPDPVSTRLVETINRPIFTKTKRLNVVGIDHQLEPYSGNGKYVAAFGGGVDSSALRVMLPDALFVHEASMNFGETVKDGTNPIVTRLQESGGGKLVTSNQRFMSRPGGWHVWIASTVTAVLAAATIGASYVVTGANFGSSFLSNGRKYFDKLNGRRHHGESGNYWEQVFWDIGLPVFSPIAGMSEIINMKVSLANLPRDEIIFCTRDRGYACGQCAKCFRRACIEGYIEGVDIDLSNYRNEEVLRVLDKKPTYFGHIYSAMLSDGWTPPAWADAKMSHLPTQATFPLRHNPEAYELIPTSARDHLVGQIRKFSSPMNAEDVEIMKRWDQTDVAPC